MKSLFSKPASIIKYALTIMAFAILLGTIFVVGFGFNTSAEFGGVYELTIDCFDETKVEEYSDVARDVLSEYGYSAKEEFVEERSICDSIIIRYASKSAVNAVKVEADVTTKLGLNENLVSVNSLTNSSATTSALNLLIVLAVVAVVMFVYVLIRMDYKRAVAVVLNFILSAILPVAICAITRIELSLASLAVILLVATMSTIILGAIFSKLESTRKYQEHEKSYLDNYLELLNANKFKVIIPAALVTLVFVCLMFTFKRALVFVGLTGLIAFILTTFVSLIFVPNLYLLLNTNRQKKIKNK